MASDSTAVNQRRVPWLYPLLVGVQTVGAALILWNGVPIYRQILMDPSRNEQRTDRLVLAVASVVLIQVAYWLRMRFRLEPPRRGHVVLGHFASFVARLSFIFGSAVFSVVFFARLSELSISPLRMIVLLAVLFSLFCYTLELERLGKALHGPEEKT